MKMAVITGKITQDGLYFGRIIAGTKMRCTGCYLEEIVSLVAQSHVPDSDVD